ADDQAALGLGRDAARVLCASGDPLEEIVEGSDPAAEQSGLQLEEFAFALLDVRPVRHDQVRLLRKDLEVSAQQKRHLPGVGRAGDEVQTQPTHGTRGARQRPAASMLRANYAAADFGRRPRRATAWPGILPAHVSQRSACLEPRRASVKLIRITAPFASSTSLTQSSQTNLVTRATDFLPLKAIELRLSVAERNGNQAAARECLIRQERSRLNRACSSRSRPKSRAPTTRKCRGRKSSIVVASRY